MRLIIQILTQALAIIKYARMTLANFDTNTEGWDDDFAKGLERVEKEIELFIASHPVPISTVARGYTATVAFCNDIMQKIAIVTGSAASKEEKMQALRDLGYDLLDSAKVYQAKSGKDADVLQLTRARVSEKLLELERS